MQTRVKWSLHGRQGFYVGPSLNHYHCYNVYYPLTKQIFTTDTVEYTEDNLFEIPFETMQEKLENSMKILATDIMDTITHGYNSTKIGVEKLKQ